MRIIRGSLLAIIVVASAFGQTVNNGSVDGLMAVGSRPGIAPKTEIEAADDFVLPGLASVVHATFTGLLTGGATPSNIGAVTVEIYRVFPNDSTNPPSGAVPTRTNSPSDVAFATRGTADGNLVLATTVLAPSFTAANSVLNGINKIPNQTTGGEGPVTGMEVQFDATFSVPFTLPEGHYFFVPQVQVTGGEFMWLSSTRPIVSPGVSFTPDLQAWIRNANLDPDWLRIGTDIVGSGTFNLSFSLGLKPDPADINFLWFFS